MKKKYKLYLLLILSFIIVSVHDISAQKENPSTYKVSGVVVDERGEALAGVTILIGDTKKGLSTDIDGKFSINLSQSPVTLYFSFVGMNRRSVIVDSKSGTLNVKLLPATQLAEVVIDGGYGLAQKRSDMVGSAYQIQAKDIEKLPAGRLDKLLDGLIPGVTVVPNSDSPGSPRTRYNIRVRGDASLSASNEPLWIIDGVPVYQGTSTNMMPGASYTISPLSYINSADIESITVLKDAASTSIYGANGANGVILVKTKKGTVTDRAEINATVRYGISQIDESTRYKVMNASQYMAYAKEAWVNGGQNINAFPYQDNDLNSYSTTDTNWGDLYYGTGQNMLAALSLRSGNAKNTNLLSLSYYKEKGTVTGNEQQRFTARFNSNYKFGDRLQIGAILSTSYNDNDLFSLGHEYYETLPIFTPYYADGYTNRLYNRIVNKVTYDAQGKPVYDWSDVKFFDNSIPDRNDNTNKQKTYMTDGSASLEYIILDGLTLTDQFGISMMVTNEEMYSARTTLDGLNSNNVPSGYSRRASATYMNWDNVLRLNYRREFYGVKLNALLGTEFQHNQYSTLYATGSGFLNDHIQEIGYSDSSTRSGYSSTDKKRSLSYLGQAGLSYLDRYFLTANMRMDGNSSFGKYSQWSKFGSVGISWNLNKENFLQYDFIKLLKLKASLGTNGNSRIDSSVSTGTYSYGDTYSYNGQMGAVSSSIANPGLSWESTTMFNAGVRAKLWNWFEIETEFYNNYTTDLLTKIYTSRTITDDRLYANVGEMRNRGFEVTINTKNIQNDVFGWNTDLIVSHNSNKITKLYNGVMTSFGTTVWAVDKPKSAFYLVRWAGVDPATGAPMWYDKNGNITFAYSADDRVILDESPDPWATGSFTNTILYKNFSLSVMLNYTFGGYTLSALAMRGLQDGYDVTSGNADIDAVTHWSKPGDLSVNPRISTVSSKSAMSSTRYLYSTTNVRLQNVALSYKVPDELCHKVKLSSCSFSLTGDNLYLWTPDQRKGHNSYKTLMNAYPVERNLSLSMFLGL
jgi:TonB-linked SusC/RagA family outer membrane protein